MSERKAGAKTFPIFLGAVMALFIGILIYTYNEAKKANPIMLDEHGQQRTVYNDTAHH